MNHRSRFTPVRWLVPLVGASFFLGSGRAEAKPELAVEIVVLDDVVACDRDGFLDLGEVGRAVVTVRNLTHRDLVGAQVMVKPLSEGLDVEAEGPLYLPTVPAYGAVWVQTDVKLSAPADGQVGLRAEVHTPAGAEHRGLAEDVFVPADVDDVAQGAWLDDVSGQSSSWSAQWRPEYGPASGWRRGLDEYGNPVWFVVGGELGADSTLESPPMRPAHNQQFILRFAQRYDLGDVEEALAGAVVELSSDGGRSWQDVYDFIDVPYDRELGEHASALEGRRAFMGRSAGLPSRQVVELDLGTIFQGETLRFRFRMAAEGPLKGAGWELDDFEVQGAYQAPFPARIPDRAQCLPATALTGRSGGLKATLPAALNPGANAAPQGQPAQAKSVEAWSSDAAPVYELSAPERAAVDALGPQAVRRAVPSFELEASPIGRVYAGQIAASGCTALGGPGAASPLALVLVLVGGAALARRRR